MKKVFFVLFVSLLLFFVSDSEANWRSEPPFSFLGMEEETLIEILGDPDKTSLHNYGGRELWYGKKVFHTVNGKVKNIFLYNGECFLTTIVGENVREWEKELGVPIFKGRSIDDELLLYYGWGEEREMEREVEVYIHFKEDGTTTSCVILWKKPTW